MEQIISLVQRSVPFFQWGSKFKYVRLSVCLSVCMQENWDIDIKNFIVSQLNQAECSYLINQLFFNYINND